MTLRRVAATACLLVALALVAVAALTPLRAADVAALDAEAQQLGADWAAATDDPDEAARLLRESNAAYAAARDLEPPVGPLRALGLGLLALAGGVALWPPRDDRDDAQHER